MTDRRPTYGELLRHPKWQRRRLEIMSRDGFRCTKCSADDKTLNVHHRIYHKGAAPWEYQDDELATLCEDCHQGEHAPELDDATLAKLGRFLSLDISECQEVVRLLWAVLQDKRNRSTAVRDWFDYAIAYADDERLRYLQSLADEKTWLRVGRLDPDNREAQVLAAQKSHAARRAAIEASGL